MTSYLRNKIPYYVQKTKFLQKKKNVFLEKFPVGRGQTTKNFFEKTPIDKKPILLQFFESFKNVFE